MTYNFKKIPAVIYCFIIFFLSLFITILLYPKNSVIKTDNNYTWDRKSIECPECKENLELFKIKSNPEFSIYIRKDKDVISNFIKSSGDWFDCINIRKLWHSLPGYKEGDYYMDAGANVGICSFGMLNLGINTISIEPIPNNLHIFTKSMLHNPKWIKQATLFKVGLGNKSETQYINVQKGNWGGSSLINLSQNYLKRKINIYTLDYLLKDFNHKIHLASVDIQGYELYMLEGANEVLKRKIIRHFYMEIWCEAYRKINISENNVYTLFEKYGYKIKEKMNCTTTTSFFDVTVSLND